MRLLLLLLLPAQALAQTPPPVRPLGPVSARSTEVFRNVVGVRALPDGRVLVNDAMRRRVLLFDSTLTSFTVVADSTPATGNAYSGRFAGLIAYRGDSTLFVDPQSLSMLVIDPTGKIGRVMSIPRPDEVGSFVGGPMGGTAAFDASGRLVYRSFRMPRPMRSADGHMMPPDMPDTAAIARIDLATRQVDTIGFIKIPRPNVQVSRDADGRMSVSVTANPLPVVDDWAVLADGSVALVRGRDYHIDWINPDGSTTSSPKMPFEWQRLSDEDKVAFIDSVKAARERMTGGLQSFVATGPRGGGAAAAEPVVVPGATGDRVTVTITQGAPDRANPPASPGGQRVTQPPRINFVSPSELPDYKPPFFAGAVRADANGNLWIRTIPTKPLAGGPVYDVVTRLGGLADRVQLPAGRSIVGFGPGGIVYMTSQNSEGMLVLERARMK